MTKGSEVSGWVDFLSGLVERHPRAWIGLGNLESRMLREEIEETAIDRPIYVTGLARSGSTILLELLSEHPDTSTHRYRDFPPVLTPRAWNWFVDRAAGGDQPAKERAHKDRIEVTPESPEAFEEVIWASFFEDLHNPERSAVLSSSTDSPEFEAFYRDHIRKLIALRDGGRYLAKGNYNVTRLGYLLKLFPDAHFIVPIRDPVWHVASLMKQHALFSRQGEEDARVVRHLQRTGHYEFGLDRRPINIGDDDAAQRVAELWAAGREIEGWAEYWAMIYGHVANVMDADPAVAAATRVVRYEDICDNPAGVMASVLDHCGLDHAGLPGAAAARISRPDYYRPDFSDDEIGIIRERTGKTARRFHPDAA